MSNWLLLMNQTLFLMGSNCCLVNNINRCSVPQQYADRARPPAVRSWHNSATPAALPDAVSRSLTVAQVGCEAVREDRSLMNYEVC